MSKRKKRGKKKKAKQAQQVKRERQHKKDKKNSFASLVDPLPLPPRSSAIKQNMWSFFGLIPFLCACMAFIYIISHPEFMIQTFKKIPVGMQIFIALGFPILTFHKIGMILNKNKKRFRSDPEYAWRYRKMDIYNDIIGSSLVMLILMYGFGLTDFISGFFISKFVWLKKSISYGIANILVWFAAGVCGNAAYAFVKNCYVKLKKNRQ